MKQIVWLEWFSDKKKIETSWNTFNLEFHIIFVFHESNNTKQLDMQSLHIYLQYVSTQMHSSLNLEEICGSNWIDNYF
jgi:hypothetical protein